MSTISTAEPVSLPRGKRWPLWRSCFALVVIAAASLLVYSNSFAVPFVYDGTVFIVKNPAVKSLSFWTYELGGNRMLGFFSFALNYAVGGFDVWGYHAVNLAIHIAAAWTLYGLVRVTLTMPRLVQRYGGAAHGVALAVALLWVVHPLQSQCVTYLYQRLEAQMALFYLLTLYTFARARGSRWPPLWYGLSVACCLLGMSTKEVMVTAPLAVLWYDRAFVADSWREIGARRTSFYCCLFSNWIVLAFLMMTRGIAYAQGGVLFVENVSPWQYALSQPGVILHYLAMAFWPDRLCLDYGWPVADTAIRIVPPLLIIGLLLALTAWAVVRRPPLGFAAGSFFLVLAPTSSIAPIKDLIFEHRMYLPLAPLIVLVVLAARAVWQWGASAMSRPRGRLARAVPALVVAAVAVALGCRTYARNDDYRSVIAVWQDVVRKRPDNRVGRYNLGTELLAEERVTEAIAQLDAALQLKPVPGQTKMDLQAHVNRGRALMKLHRWGEAIDDFDRAVQIRNAIPLAYKCRGMCYEELNQPKNAITDYCRAIELAPGDAELFMQRGRLYRAVGRRDFAVEDFSRAAELDYDSAEPLLSLANCYLDAQRSTEAQAALDKAIRLDPKCAAAYLSRARCYFSQRLYSRAWADVQQSRQLGTKPSAEFLQDLKSKLPHVE